MAEDKFEAVDPLARVSRERGSCCSKTCIELIPAGSRGFTLDALALDVPVSSRGRRKTDDRRFEEADDFVEIESLDKTHDPVRLYLREMGSVPLLNRDGEIGIARRIERGQTKTRRSCRGAR